VREGGGYGGDNDRVVDLRVDDHPEPIREVARIRDLHTLYFGETGPDNIAVMEGDVKRDLVASLGSLGHLEVLVADKVAQSVKQGLVVRAETFEEREQKRGYLDRAVLEFIKEKR
jgi:uncharacterized Ntn-hydrolase superfamily protein